jgi:MoxR-like ATPase
LSETAVDAFRQSAASDGTGHLVPVAGSPLLEAFLEKAEPSTAPDAVAAAARAFIDGVAASGVRLSDDLVRAFFAALAAKPFAILTGLSGSGKTQLAMRLGDWLGSDDAGRPRFLLVPVRPDWTGPEYLFGYRDVLRSSAEGEVWAVPDALEFILRAHNEPGEPHLLVLDEMNLAHVERYFADFLSGIESRQPILPELRPVGNEWRATGNAQRLPLPRNLIVVGTVNVDETTYLFSPKVLDRAFTFEFRTSADELDPSLGRPTSLAPGDPTHRRTFVRLLADDAWHRANASPPAEAIFTDLKELHALLSPSSHEFGHRVLHEALRFAAFLHAVGVTDRWRVLDWILLTKLLPKMHGTRARVEQPLRDLLEFAIGDSGDLARARMPRSASKLDRMLKVLMQAQFVSFTE